MGISKDSVEMLAMEEPEKSRNLASAENLKSGSTLLGKRCKMDSTSQSEGAAWQTGIARLSAEQVSLFVRALCFNTCCTMEQYFLLAEASTSWGRGTALLALVQSPALG